MVPAGVSKGSSQQHSAADFGNAYMDNVSIKCICSFFH